MRAETVGRAALGRAIAAVESIEPVAGCADVPNSGRNAGPMAGKPRQALERRPGTAASARGNGRP